MVERLSGLIKTRCNYSVPYSHNRYQIGRPWRSSIGRLLWITIEISATLLYLSPLRLSGKLRGRRSYDVSSFSVFKIHACHKDEGFVILAGFFAGFTGWCLSTTSSVFGGGGHVGMTTFSFQWITTEFSMKSHIYWYLKCYPFLWSYCDQIVFFYFMWTLSQILLLSTSLLLGSFSYVFNIVIVLTCIVSICSFWVSLSLILLVCIFTYNFYALCYLWVLCIINLWYCLYVYLFMYLFIESRGLATEWC